MVKILSSLLFFFSLMYLIHSFFILPIFSFVAKTQDEKFENSLTFINHYISCKILLLNYFETEATNIASFMKNHTESKNKIMVKKTFKCINFTDLWEIFVWFSWIMHGKFKGIWFRRCIKNVWLISIYCFLDWEKFFRKG